jgi:hypothetical protein
MRKYLFLFCLILIFSCKKKAEVETQLESEIPVTLTKIDTSGIESYVDLNATATYLVKNIIKANVTGYLNSVNVQNNDFVNRNKILFTLQSREAKALGNTINKLDSNLNFGSAIKIKATTSGYITNLNAQNGDYVQDGDQLAIINDSNSFGIILSLPYELKKYIKIGQELTVFLPDGRSIKTIVQQFMPSVDVPSQTQNVVLKYNGNDIPENLIVRVRIYKNTKSTSISLPKSAVLSNETETDFWIMKMINNTTAVKIPIQKGITTDDRIEIIAPKLNKDDRILTSGNYGVSDTIRVKIVR